MKKLNEVSQEIKDVKKHLKELEDIENELKIPEEWHELYMVWAQAEQSKEMKNLQRDVIEICKGKLEKQKLLINSKYKKIFGRIYIKL